MADKARKLAVTALRKVSDGGFSNIVIDSLLDKSGFERRDRAFASAIFYGTLERRITLDYLVKRYSSRPLEKLDPDVLEILRSGMYQIMFMNSVPDFSAVDESVELAKKMLGDSAGKFVNAVLRSFLREGKEKPFEGLRGFEKMSVRYSAPLWLTKMWCAQLGPDNAVKALTASLGMPESYIRANTQRTDPGALAERLLESGIRSETMDFPAGALKAEIPNVAAMVEFGEGLFHVQDLSSQMAVAALGASKGERILDVCAAPGGKSFTMAEMMEDEGEIVACDVHRKRCDLIESGANRLGLGIIKTEVNDGTVYSEKLGTFDRILCDVPCSGLGVIRRKPEIRFKDYREVKTLPPVQYKIASTSAKYLKKGGTMMYSTCTLSDEENSAVVKRLITEAGLVPRELPEPFKKYSDDGYSVRLLPGQIGSDGFYFALLGKD